MKIKLPIQTKEFVDGNLKITPGEREFELDMSLASQIRYEAKFPNLAEREDLFNYSKRISEIKELTAGVIISKMKLLYCWFDTDIDFIEFLKMFDLSDIEFSKKLTTQIHDVFELILNGSAEKN